MFGQRVKDAAIVGLAVAVVVSNGVARFAARGLSRGAQNATRLGAIALAEARWVGPAVSTWVSPHVREFTLDVRAAVGQSRRWIGPQARSFGSTMFSTFGRRRVVRTGRVAFVAALVVMSLMGAGVAMLDPGVELVAGTVDVEHNPLEPLTAESTVVASDGSPFGVVPGGTNRIQVPLDAIPDHVEALVLAAEDRRFYEHSGYDRSAILRAAVANVRAGEVTQGGSTITQQLAKRNYTGDDRTPLRKVREVAYAAALEEKLSKRELLERYLNEVYFGGGAYGIAAAARTFFGVDVGSLRVEQAALLAAIVRAPSTLDPWRNPEGAASRRDVVLRLAAEDGNITRRDLDAALAAPLGVVDAPTRSPVVEPQLLAAVEDEIAQLDALGPSPDARLAALRTGQWRVETTIDTHLHASASAALRGRLGDTVSGAVAMIEPRTGRIRALAAHQPGVPRPFPLATRARRQPGSTFKTVAAVAALEAGVRPDQRYEGRGPRRFELEREDWVVDNFDEADYSDVDLAVALRDSVNTAFAQISVAVGADRIADAATRMGIPAESAMGAPSERGPALGLGGLRHGVSPLELANAYATIAADGRTARATVIERVVTHDGRVLYEHEDTSEQAIDPAIAGTVRTMLQSVVADGTGGAARLDGWSPLGKTGTSQDRADAWFVGSLPHITAAVWVGHSDRRESMPSATGGATAAPIWRDAIAPAATSPQPFAEPAPFTPGDGVPLPKALPCSDRIRACDEDKDSD